MKVYTQFFVFDNFKAEVELEKEPYISEGETFTLTVKLRDSGLIKSQQWVSADVYVSAGLTVESGAHFTLPMHNSHKHEAEREIVVRAENLTSDCSSVLIDFSVHGRHTYGVAKIKLMSR